PFFELLQQYNNISLSLHQSGILWNWQEKNHPEYLELIKSLIAKGQVELLTGGFYEPILSSIPERDIKGQIARLNQYIKKHFNFAPEGLWLTERIWEPHLPKVLNQSGLKFLPVDDTHFIYAGWEQKQLTGPFITEYENHKVIILPISKRLRYLIPFGTVGDIIEELKILADKNPSGMIIYADDGEKFGVWPDTNKHCYQDKWLENFFDAIGKNDDWLEVVPLNVAAETEPVGRAYLPSASYAEMLHWSLPPEAFVEYDKFEHYLKEQGQLEKYNRFVRGGHWRGFLTKYEEANLMHKKMLYVSDKLESLEKNNHKKNKLLNSARERLYAGQCNCAYWHGVFGGLYLPHMRQAIYANLIEANKVLNSILNKTKNQIEIIDYDADGKDEIIFDGEKLSAIFKPDKGGMLLELSLNTHNFCLTDTLTRRKEGYHLKLDQASSSPEKNKTVSIHDLIVCKEEGLKDLLVDDWYLKRCFIDHFFKPDVECEVFRTAQFDEEGDFILEPYEYKTDKKTNNIILSRIGHLWRAEEIIPISVVKQFSIDNDTSMIKIKYEISSNHKTPVEVNFAIENNFNFQAGHSKDRYILLDNKRPKNSYLDSSGSYPTARTYTMVDEYRDIAIAFSAQTSGDIWHMPIYTVSLS
ncbi:MAG: alpha-amylase/4-alpha-glucanotransferase domain-containing protein, partial [Candidatus Zixiibacteriota bacterium]